MRAGSQRGAAAIEVVAAVPALLLAGLLAWYLAFAIVVGIDMQEELRGEALARIASSGVPPGEPRTTTIESRRSVRPVPVLPRLTLRARLAVPAP